MIDIALKFIKDELSAYLKRMEAAIEDFDVVFPDTDSSDESLFKMNKITLMLLNIEQESSLREPDLYRKVSARGAVQRVNPDVSVSLVIMLVARMRDYTNGLRYISNVIQFFLSNPVFSSETHPNTKPEIDRLVLELMTLPLAQQHELWSAMKTAYLPSVLYRVKLLVFQDSESRPAEAWPAEIRIDVKKIQSRERGKDGD
jgi:hypothetical protein